MTMTDPIADMLTRLRNANSAYHDTVGMPYSKIKSHIAEILQQEGYIAAWRVEDADVGRNLVITLKYGNQRERSIAGIKRVSKPGLREEGRPAARAGRPGHRDHLDLGRPHDRQAGQEARRGRGSPRLRLVREELQCQGSGGSP